MRPSASEVTISAAGERSSSSRSLDTCCSSSAIRACNDSWSLWVIVGLVSVPLPEPGDATRQPRERVGPDLRRPLRVDRVEAEETEVEGEVGHEQRIAGEDEARWEEEAVGLGVPLEAVEVAELGDDLPGVVDDDDLVALVGAHPEVVLLVDDEAVRSVDAVGEDGGETAGRSAVDDLNDGVVAGVGDEE